MEDHFLDQELISEHELADDVKKETAPLRWIAIAILWLGLAFFLVTGSIFHPRILMGGLTLAVITTVAQYSFEMASKLTYLGIIAGIFGLVLYLPLLYYFEFELLGIVWRIDPILVGVLIIHHLVQGERRHPLLNSILGDNKDVSIALGRERSKVEGFKRRFEKKPIEELKAIVANDRLLPHARRAAQELIINKQTSVTD